ncbi:hypothetical protein HYU90_03050 [Candidatus Collierbacteria bacterium]|nr:hypothetical protein [Candidatus Collierbacteria bacterium]
MDTLPELSVKEKEMLDGIAQLVDFTTNGLMDHPINKNSLSVKQTLLLAMFAPINSYTEAIFELCGKSRPDAANVILRSIVEGWINSIYVLGHPNNKTAYMFAIEDSYYRRGFAIEALCFYKRYPKQQSNIITDEFLMDLLNKSTSELETYRVKQRISFKNKEEFKAKWGTLLSRAQWVDARLRKKQGDRAGGIEHTYLLAYRLLSEYAHLSMRGLEHFRVKGNNEESIILDKNPKGIDLVLATTFTIYLHFAKRLKQYKLVNCSFSKFEKFFREKVTFATK